MNEQKNLRFFTEAYRRGKLSQAYIIEGMDPGAAETFARELSQALLCHRIDETLRSGEGLLRPCGTCPSCIKAKTGNHPDIIRVTHEKDTVLSVGEIREQVVGDIAIKPYYGPYKIYLVPQAQLMNENAQNALLKTIEEPQDYALILLLTDNADGFLPTIRSRCVRIRMPDPSREEAARRLLDEDGERALEIIRTVPSMSAVEITKASKELEEMDRQQVLSLFQFWIRDLLVWKSTGEVERLYYRSYTEDIRRVSENISYEALNQMLLSWESLRDRLRAKVRMDTAGETFLLKLRSCAGR